MTDNPFRAALERRLAERRAAIATITTDDMADVVRQLATAAANGDPQALDRVSALGPQLQAIVAREVERISADKQAALLARRRHAGATAEAVDAPKATDTVYVGQPPSDAPQATAQRLPGMTIIDYGKPSKPPRLTPWLVFQENQHPSTRRGAQTGNAWWTRR